MGLRTSTMSDLPCQRHTPCPECPWQRSAPPGKFGVERYESLIGTAQQSFGTMFACHMTQEGRESPCAGYLAVTGATSITVRLAVANKLVDLAKIESAVADGDYPPMYGSYAEMAVANGVDPDLLDDPDLWTGRGPLGQRTLRDC